MFIVLPLLSPAPLPWCPLFISGLFFQCFIFANRSTDAYFYFLFAFKDGRTQHCSFLLNIFWWLFYISSFPFFCACSFLMMNIGCLYSIAVIKVAAGNNPVDMFFCICARLALTQWDFWVKDNCEICLV